MSDLPVSPVNGEEVKPDIAGEFNAHLDVCRRCRNNPFDLCPIGTQLADKAWSRISEALKTSLFRSSTPGGTDGR